LRTQYKCADVCVVITLLQQSRHDAAAGGCSVHQLLTKREPKTKGAGSCSDVCHWKDGWEVGGGWAAGRGTHRRLHGQWGEESTLHDRVAVMSSENLNDGFGWKECSMCYSSAYCHKCSSWMYFDTMSGFLSHHCTARHFGYSVKFYRLRVLLCRSLYLHTFKTLVIHPIWINNMVCKAHFYNRL